MMDPYNLAICFGPTLLPIPEDKDQVQYQNAVNELIKNIIMYQEDVFPADGGPVYEKYILSPEEDIQPDMPDAGQDDFSEDGSEYGYKDSDEESEVFDAVAQYDFEGRSSHELTFRKGANITLHSQVSPDWWKGSLEGKAGLVPDKYIAVMKTR
ncbi:PREDICTED: SLIT-ROBO Rho GTPase-activating protein 1-like [Priapulus caudatus]|uniref:SLIT-ROBO Rho GTPase-activating protein 1-like n=1 Tax=Priapulus caudatus TaxID=37621 RepID=A0ABM1F1D9_PRICU|nr:PREDICTED: SLIT-ROBO Rho GTPase-activating protein 1-like [Priapulus caudatus]